MQCYISLLTVYQFTITYILCVFAVALKFGVGVALVLVAHVVLVRKWNAGRYSLFLCLARSHCQHDSLFVTVTNNAFPMLEILHSLSVVICMCVCLCGCLTDRIDAAVVLAEINPVLNCKE